MIPSHMCLFKSLNSYSMSLKLLLHAAQIAPGYAVMTYRDDIGSTKMQPNECQIQCPITGCHADCAYCVLNGLTHVTIGPMRSQSVQTARCACTTCAGNECDALIWRNAGCSLPAPDAGEHSMWTQVCRVGKDQPATGLPGWVSAGACAVYFDPRRFLVFQKLCPLTG